MDKLKLDAIGLCKCTLFRLSPIWKKMAGIMVCGPLF